MKTIFHSSDSRGHANHGWLNAKHSFSFASWYNPDRVHFGNLRVLNDDTVAPGMGFGTHPHDNMEIITIPLSGALTHQDSMGNKATIQAGEIQVMSAGTGIQHSEFNANEDQDLTLLQIWVFPNKRNVAPRYDQQVIDFAAASNQFKQILSPSSEDDGVWIHQNAWFNIGKFDRATDLTIQLNDTNNGVYAFVIEGEMNINGQNARKRDAIGLWETQQFDILIEANSTILLMEIPMQLPRI